MDPGDYTNFRAVQMGDNQREVKIIGTLPSLVMYRGLIKGGNCVKFLNLRTQGKQRNENNLGIPVFRVEGKTHTIYNFFEFSTPFVCANLVSGFWIQLQIN